MNRIKMGLMAGIFIAQLVTMFLILTPMPEEPSVDAPLPEILQYSNDVQSVNDVRYIGSCMLFITIILDLWIAAWTTDIPPHIHPHMAISESRYEEMMSFLFEKYPNLIAGLPAPVLQALRPPPAPPEERRLPVKKPRKKRDRSTTILYYFILCLIVGSIIFLSIIWFM